VLLALLPLTHTVTRCNTLQHIATIATCCHASQHTATPCQTLTQPKRKAALLVLLPLQHTAIHFDTLQNTAAHCNTLQHTHQDWNKGRAAGITLTATHCNTLQHTATHCNTLQRTASYCSTLHTLTKLELIVRNWNRLKNEDSTAGITPTAIHCVTWRIHICDMPHSYVWRWHYSHCLWLIHMRDMTHSYAWHDSFICVTWLIHIRDMTHDYTGSNASSAPTAIHCNTRWHTVAPWHIYTNESWDNLTWGMSHDSFVYMCHDSCICICHESFVYLYMCHASCQVGTRHGTYINIQMIHGKCI